MNTRFIARNAYIYKNRQYFVDSYICAFTLDVAGNVYFNLTTMTSTTAKIASITTNAQQSIVR